MPGRPFPQPVPEAGAGRYAASEARGDAEAGPWDMAVDYFLPSGLVGVMAGEQRLGRGEGSALEEWMSWLPGQSRRILEESVGEMRRRRVRSRTVMASV